MPLMKTILNILVHILQLFELSYKCADIVGLGLYLFVVDCTVQFCVFSLQIADYRCECFPGWTGTNCGIELNNCMSDPCGNEGTCISYQNQFQCICDEGRPSIKHYSFDI